MTTPNPLRSLVCPTCGAPLDIHVDEPTTHCQYCNAVIANPEYHPPAPVQPPAPIHIQVERPVYTPSKSKAGCSSAIGVIILALVVLGIGGGALVAFGVNSARIHLPKITLFPLQIEPPAIMINSEGGAPNIIAGTYDVAKNSYALSRLDLGSQRALWSTLDQKDYLRVDALLAGDTYLYVVMETRLVALQLADGAQAWEASLPDNLVSSCKSCILFQKGQVLVLTIDNSLGAYDAQTGHQTWEKRFDNIGSTLYPVEGGVALLYTAKNGAALGIFDVSSSNEITHIEPTCQYQDSIMTDEMSVFSNIIVDNSSQAEKVYTFYGLFNACVQRWDISTGKIDWEYVEPDQNLMDVRENLFLLSNGVLYYVQDDQLRSLDAASGKQMQILEESQDYSLIPMFAEGQRLVVRATRTSGATRYELWGYDLDNGKNLWKRPILKSAPIDPPGEMIGLIDADETGWTYRLTPAGLWLITFQTQPNQVNIAQVNLDTGEMTNQKTALLGIDSNTDFYNIPARIDSGGQVTGGPDQLAWYVMFNRIYAIDPETGVFPYRWP